MGGLNAAIDVGKHQLNVALGSDGALFEEPNQARAICAVSQTAREAGLCAGAD
jgi:hypothetical protein